MAVTRSICHLTPEGRIENGAGPRRSVLVWPYTQGWKWQTRRCEEHLLDPVNLVIAGATPSQVMTALQTQGWAVPDAGGLHRLWVNRLLRPMRTHATHGTYEERTHVRLWSVRGHTIAAAHHEFAEGRGHMVTTWNGARAAVGDALQSAGFVSRGLGEVVTLPDIRGLPNDGRVLTLASDRT
jgi:hypothetical protein